MRSFYLVESPLVKPSLSINEGFPLLWGPLLRGSNVLTIHEQKNTDKKIIIQFTWKLHNATLNLKIFKDFSIFKRF